MSDKYVLDGKRAVPIDNLLEWAMKFETQDRKVARTEISEGVSVSTVFLGIDHSFGGGPPLLFETMVFGGERDQCCERCSTWEEAERQHEKMVAELRGAAV